MLCNLIFFANCVFCLSYEILSLNSHSTNHAGVIMCCCHDSSSITVLYSFMIWGVHYYYFNELWSDADGKSANVNLQKEGMWNLSLYAFLLRPNQCHVFATTLTKVLVQRKQMDD